MVLKASLNVNLRPKRGDACVYIEAGGCARGGHSASTPPPARSQSRRRGERPGPRPERVSARRPPAPPRSPPPAARRPPSAQDPLVAAAGSNSVHLSPSLPSRSVSLSRAPTDGRDETRARARIHSHAHIHTHTHGAHSLSARLAARLLPSHFSSLPGPRPPPASGSSPACAVAPAPEVPARLPFDWRAPEVPEPASRVPRSSPAGPPRLLLPRTPDLALSIVSSPGPHA